MTTIDLALDAFNNDQGRVQRLWDGRVLWAMTAADLLLDGDVDAARQAAAVYRAMDRQLTWLLAPDVEDTQPIPKVEVCNE